MTAGLRWITALLWPHNGNNAGYISSLCNDNAANITAAYSSVNNWATFLGYCDVIGRAAGTHTLTNDGSESFGQTHLNLTGLQCYVLYYWVSCQYLIFLLTWGTSINTIWLYVNENFDWRVPLGAMNTNNGGKLKATQTLTMQVNAW